MPRTATVPELLDELRTFLDQRFAEYDQGGRASPNLPSRGGRINVRSLMQEFRQWGEERGVEVPESVRQYVYNEAEWGALIDVAAQDQGLTATKTTETAKSSDAAEDRIVRLSKDVKNQSEGHALARARIVHLERKLAEKEAENARLRERFAFIQRTGMVLRTDDVQ
ncbi:hypothetical protein PMNALOAF_2467 [Methylobacterium adhaesivum]|uniref:KfrA N-terminal DNA-binding domain-containing protein n=1 Tax=Methylobacterium adhaesivum TaxID=333297 RepID=A0ABT8BHL3_9HYPH|nr:hypothetical protein [Methylobacterium adhaesivum]MDN3591648.1 hypothetical protein [Methylobacterium adhaesivum]GJD31213.1 hypothetical protein PMNALOAF_2467 [Methylobacterium adhaesivum]